MSFKQYTTPVIKMQLAGSADILQAASDVILTVSDGEVDVDMIPEINGETLTATMTEEQTGQLEVGDIYIEATVKVGSSVFKTKTIKDKMLEAVRNRAVE